MAIKFLPIHSFRIFDFLESATAIPESVWSNAANSNSF